MLADAASRLVAAFSACARSAAPMAVTALWQGAAVAVALALCLRLSPRVSAAHRFVVWAAGFTVVVGLPLLPWLAPVSRVGAAVAAPMGAETPHSWFQLDSRWGFLIAALWLAASAFRAAQLCGRLVRLRGLLKAATPVEIDGSLRSLLDAVSPACRTIAIRTTRELDRPCVVGFFSPRILIPEWLFDRLTPEELEQVAMHEAEHLHRRDDWSNLAQKLALAIFPLNPALAWMERRLCREREMACDEGVVRRTQAPRAYAACLTSVAERGLERRDLLRRAHALSLGAFERRPELVRRVHSILRNKRALHPVAARALVGIVGCGLLFGSVELARSPQIVAFVAAPKADAQALAVAPVLADPSSTTRTQNTSEKLTGAAGGFHAVETKAILPPSRITRAPMAGAAPNLRAKQPAAVADAVLASTNGAPRPKLTATQIPGSATVPAEAQQVIVFTAWEETRTTRRVSRAVADYDSGASAEQQPDAAAGQASPGQAMRITVTRMIFAVYPASAAPANPAPNAKTTRTPVSPSNRPPAPPVDGGWLVFEL
jgi:beta-lactamase regulating signal transducer with metallopeptidase domain